MYPDRETALRELELGGQLNPGPWTAHCKNVAAAAEAIALVCGMDAEKAYVCGLLHDIGRREGVHGMRHIIDGYSYAMSKGWDEVARICLTHSFSVQDVNTILGKRDCTPEETEFIRRFLRDTEYDDYDRLIILCDALGEAAGFCILEKRLVDVARRYGLHSFTLDRWNSVFATKEYFDDKADQNIYRLLPGIENCIYN